MNNLFNQQTVQELMGFTYESEVYSGPEGTITLKVSPYGAVFEAKSSCHTPWTVDGTACAVCDGLPEAITYLKVMDEAIE